MSSQCLANRMNAPKHELDKRKAESERVAKRLQDFRNSEPHMKTAIMEDVAMALDRVYPNLQGFCLEKESPTAVFNLKVALDFTPGAMSAKVTAKVVPTGAKAK